MSYQQKPQQQPSSRSNQPRFTASEVATFEYCPLLWWYESFEPLAKTGTEELFARLVELEHEHGPQATALPEYQMIEQLLLRQGAFDEGQQQHRQHAAEVQQAEEAAALPIGSSARRARILALLAVAVLLVALLLIVVALLRL